MKKSLLQITVFCILVAMFASCASAYDTRKSRTCPSHDPMYFRR
ncbi:hypothetical protein [Panacibacter ginsenosidivorans]|nr:hypothetical protein [Panacibacter ginsenosidivorans]